MTNHIDKAIQGQAEEARAMLERLLAVGGPDAIAQAVKGLELPPPTNWHPPVKITTQEDGPCECEDEDCDCGDYPSGAILIDGRRGYGSYMTAGDGTLCVSFLGANFEVTDWDKAEANIRRMLSPVANVTIYW